MLKKMKSPAHPGSIVRDCLEELRLTVTAAADVLGVARQTLNNLVNEKGGISAEMAIRLSKAFGGSPRLWIDMQANYDLTEALKHEKDIKVKTVPGATAYVEKAATADAK